MLDVIRGALVSPLEVGILYFGDRKKGNVGALSELEKSKKGKFTLISHSLPLLSSAQPLTFIPLS